MMAAFANDTALRGELRENEPMARHTSWRTGGTAKRWYKPADERDVLVFLETIAADEALYWMGLGSNVLVRDGGFNGTVIATFGVFSALEVLNATQIRAGVGIACAKVARFSAANNLVGGEFLIGIPGTMGGALAMNAGAFGGSTWDHVVEVETLDRFGNSNIRSPEDYEIGYRHVLGPPGEWFVSAVLELKPGEKDLSLAKIKELLARRGSTQPTQHASCGSVFRNPPDDYAARLIESVGLKGFCVGGACVSEKHANFILNTGDASATDIERLIREIQAKVKQAHGIQLETEVCIVGEPSGARENQVVGKESG